MRYLEASMRSSDQMVRPGVSQSPTEELAAWLRALRGRLAALTACDPARDAPACLRSLREYLLDDLAPVLHGLQLRVRPALRQQLGVRGDQQVATEHARLLPLTERVVALPAAGEVDERCVELEALTRELAALADRHLARELCSLPGLPDRLSPADTARLLAAAQGTAGRRSYRTAPRADARAAVRLRARRRGLRPARVVRTPPARPHLPTRGFTRQRCTTGWVSRVTRRSDECG